jgi:hypothetical protein
MRLYLPAEWTSDFQRLGKAGVPEDVTFKTKRDIALELLERALDWGVKRQLFLVDCGYGNDIDFCEELTRRGLPYIVGIRGDSVVWPPEFDPPPLPPKPAGMSRPARTRYRYGEAKPVAAQKLAADLPPTAWKSVRWGEGSKGLPGPGCMSSAIRSSSRISWGWSWMGVAVSRNMRCHDPGRSAWRGESREPLQATD